MNFFVNDVFIFPESTPLPLELREEEGRLVLSEGRFAKVAPQIGDDFHSTENAHKTAERFDWVPFKDIEWVAVQILVYEQGKRI
jgi:hypothetical protein